MHWQVWRQLCMWHASHRYIERKHVVQEYSVFSLADSMSFRDAVAARCAAYVCCLAGMASSLSGLMSAACTIRMYNMCRFG